MEKDRPFISHKFEEKSTHDTARRLADYLKMIYKPRSIRHFIDWEVIKTVIVVFKKAYDLVDGKKRKNYNVYESARLVAGSLIAAIHNAGLVTPTHTPSPMNFLQRVLNRPENERPCFLSPFGYLADGAVVPDLHRKTTDDVIMYSSNV